MLKYALDVCKEKGMAYAILGCYDKNTGSNKTIVKNGGTIYRTEIENKKLSDNWEIDLRCNYYKIIL